MTGISVRMFVPESPQSPSNVVLSCDDSYTVTPNKPGMVHSAGNGIAGMFTQVGGEQDVLQRTEILNMYLDWLICSGQSQVQKL